MTLLRWRKIPGSTLSVIAASSRGSLDRFGLNVLATNWLGAFLAADLFGPTCGFEAAKFTLQQFPIVRTVSF